MRSQWECLLENLGEWQGSFTRLSPQGNLLEDTETVVSLTGLNNNQTIRQTIRRFPPKAAPEEKVIEYSSLGRGVLFFENGAFSQGSIQWGQFSEFGAELGFINGNSRLRLVQLFNKSHQLEGITLIREKLAGSEIEERSPLKVDDLCGEWRGEAITLYPDWRSPENYSTNLKLSRQDDRLVQQLNFGDRAITSSAKIDGNILHFNQGNNPIQVLLLPDGASATFPIEIKPHQPFFLEAGWLIQPNLRQRMIRSYSDKGEWVSLTLVTEHLVN